jgi:hypothetical protein
VACWREDTERTNTAAAASPGGFAVDMPLLVVLTCTSSSWVVAAASSAWVVAAVPSWLPSDYRNSDRRTYVHLKRVPSCLHVDECQGGYVAVVL